MDLDLEIGMVVTLSARWQKTVCKKEPALSISEDEEVFFVITRLKEWNDTPVMGSTQYFCSVTLRRLIKTKPTEEGVKAYTDSLKESERSLNLAIAAHGDYLQKRDITVHGTMEPLFGWPEEE